MLVACAQLWRVNPQCIYGIWLVPTSEVLNGILKWYFRVPRPGWADPKVEMKVERLRIALHHVSSDTLSCIGTGVVA